MKPKTKLISLLLVMLLLLAPTGSAAAKGLMDGRVIVANSFILSSGEVLNGDLVIFGGSGTIEAGATVNGDAVLVGGSLTIDGEVSGDVVVVGGALSLGGESVVHGNVSTVGASLSRAEGSVVEGDIYNSATDYSPGEDVTPNVPAPPVPVIPNVDIPVPSLMSTAANIFFRALMLALLAALLAVFLPDQMGRVSQAVLSQPILAGGMGLLTIVVVPVGMLILAVTLILIPVSALVFLVWLLAMLFGWIAIGTEFGVRLARSSTNPWPAWLSAGLGTFLLTLVANGIGEFVWCVGWLIPFAISVIGLGGVVMTRFGMQVALPPVAVSPPAPPAAGE
ncbi:MAG: hypothetical protein AB1846_01400 [Chloroflexota bacterium]